MTEKFEAAKRIACLTPKDIHALDDDSTVKLVADLAMIGTGRSAGEHVTNPPMVRAVVSKASYWATCLIAANRILRGEEMRASDPQKTPIERKAPQTRKERLQHVAQRGECGITASECNEFLRSLPPVPLYGDD